MLDIEDNVLACDGKPFLLYTLENQQGMRVVFTDWGATWLSCQVPVKGEHREVLLGCKLADLAQQQVYLGATIGRYANRIKNARYTWQGKTVQLVANQGNHQLHGGVKGFDKQRWQLVEQCQDSLTFSLFSPDGDQGFPGNLTTQVRYQLTEENGLRIEYRAKCDQDCALNLTNHTYFNLENAQAGDVRQHWLRLNADFYLPVDHEGIPHSALKHVRDSSFDFRLLKQIGRDLLQDEQHLTKGYDHSFITNGAWAKPCVLLQSANQDLSLEVLTSQAAVHVYSGNYLNGTPNRQGTSYTDYAGIAFETQCLPDTPNHPEWQNYGGITKAGEPYYQWTLFRFITSE